MKFRGFLAISDSFISTVSGGGSIIVDSINFMYSTGSPGSLVSFESPGGTPIGYGLDLSMV